MISITIKHLRQYRHTKANLLLLETELDEIILKTKAFDGTCRGSGVSDTVAQIVMEREKIRRHIQSLTDKKNAVEAYLSQCDEYYGLLLRWHYVDGKTWTAIALTLGGGNSEDSVKKSCYRYVIKNP